ncbi:MAG: hypothetical protein RLZZ385_791 [Pseudomonadota bacterium]|jgi:thiamine-monophosphate kinase
MQREFDIIHKYFREAGIGFAKPGVDLGIGDDCALLSIPPERQLALSMDLLQEGVHFPENAIPQLIAHRALAVNLSDLAAAGAEPLCFTLGLSVPSADATWLEAFSRGLLEAARRYDCPLAGGDLIHGTLTIAIQVQGTLPRGKALLRSTAQPGDLVYVTGTLGDAAVALSVFARLSDGDTPATGDLLEGAAKPSVAQRDFFIHRFYQPTARLAAGIALRDYASSCIDLSDGLLSDLTHIVEDSGVGVELDVDQLPYSAAMLAVVSPDNRRRAALCGGDDYELCFSVPPEKCAAMEAALGELQVPIKRIGEIISGSGIRCLDSLGEPVEVDCRPFSHFPEQD